VIIYSVETAFQNTLLK